MDKIEKSKAPSKINKKIKTKIWIVAAVAMTVTAAGIIHTAIEFVGIARAGMETSFPASVALFLLIPYAIAVAIDLLVGGLVIRKIARKQ